MTAIRVAISSTYPPRPQKRRGTIANVVFSTGIDRRDDLGSRERFGVYYGMADGRIGVARLAIPACLSREAVADPPAVRRTRGSSS